MSTEVRVILYSRDHQGYAIPPRTKKNSPEVLCPEKIRTLQRHVIVPSPEYREWETGCTRAAVYDRTAPAITHEVNCTALIYRDRNVGDAVGYYQAIADTLEKLGVVKNDRLIHSWDGTRLLKDPENPRVEVTLTAIAGAQPALFGPSVEETRSAAIERKAEMKAKRKAREMVGV